MGSSDVSVYMERNGVMEGTMVPESGFKTALCSVSWALVHKRFTSNYQIINGPSGQFRSRIRYLDQIVMYSCYPLLM